MSRRLTLVTFSVVLGTMAWAAATQAFATAATHDYSLAWVRQVGTSSSDFGMAVAVDASGNVFLGGITSGSLGGANAGYQDLFLTKCDPAGNVAWSRQLGGSCSDQAYSVAVDTAGNAYLAGQTPCCLGGSCPGGCDAVWVKYDTLGNRPLTKQYGTSDADWGLSAAVDATGNIYTTGYTSGNLGGTNAGSDDTFLVKHNASSGAVVWARQFGTSSADRGNALALDAAGNIFLAGQTGGSLHGPYGGSGDAFAAKYDSAGNQVWVSQFGSTEYDECYAVAVDGLGNTYVGGTTFGALPGWSSAGGRDAFLAKYDSAGNLLWTKQFGTSSTDVVESMAVNAAGNLLVGGYTGGCLAGSCFGGSDVFAFEYDPSGNPLWSGQFGTSGNEQCRSLTLDAAGNLYCGGYTSGSFGGPNAGGDDAFAMKLLAPVPEPSAVALLTTAAASLLVVARRRRATKASARFARRNSFRISWLALGLIALVLGQTGLAKAMSVSGEIEAETASAGRVLWDISHCTYTNYKPSSFYKSLADNLALHDFVVDTTTAKLTNVDLSAYDAIVVGVVYENPTMPVYSSAEVACITNFVANGGGLLILGDNKYYSNASIQPVATPFGVTLNKSLLASYDFHVSNFAYHPLFDGIDELCMSYCSEIDANPAANEVAWTNSKAVVVAGTYGDGHFVAIGDTTLFVMDPPYSENYSQSDNKAFSVNVFNYLANPVPEPSTVALLATAAASLLVVARRRRATKASARFARRDSFGISSLALGVIALFLGQSGLAKAVTVSDEIGAETVSAGRVLWDISHYTSTTYQPSGVYQGLASVLTLNGFVVNTTTEKLPNVDLSAYDTIVVGINENSGMAVYSSAEVACIANFVSNGGGLLILADNADPKIPNAKIQPVATAFGVTLGLSSACPGDISVADFANHPVFDGIHELFMHGAGEIDAVPVTNEIAWACDKTLIAAGTYGNGRFVALGDASMLMTTPTVSYFAYLDNVPFAMNVFHHLANPVPEPSAVALLTTAAASLVVVGRRRRWCYPRG